MGDRSGSKAKDFDTKGVLAVSAAHFTHDTYTAFLPPLLPLLIEKLSLSLTLAGSLTFFVQLPSMLNPLIGHLADRGNLRLFVVLAPAVSGTLMSILGLADSYMQLAFLLSLTGVSVAFFHAPAPAFVARLSGERVGRGMSFFMTGGELGRTVGPLFAAWMVAVWGVGGMYRGAVIGWLFSFWLYRRLPKLPRERPSTWAGSGIGAARKMLLPVIGLLTARGFLISSIGVFLPTLLKGEGVGLVLAAGALSLYELAGVFGALVSGTVSDHFGRRPILLIGISSSAFLMAGLLLSRGWLMIPLLVGLGFVSLSTQPVMLALVQDQFPDRRALANGIYLALSFILRPSAAVVIGLLGDEFGLRASFGLAAGAQLLVLPLVSFLPGDRTTGPA